MHLKNKEMNNIFSVYQHFLCFSFFFIFFCFLSQFPHLFSNRHFFSLFFCFFLFLKKRIDHTECCLYCWGKSFFSQQMTRRNEKKMKNFFFFWGQKRRRKMKNEYEYELSVLSVKKYFKKVKRTKKKSFLYSRSREEEIRK